MATDVEVIERRTVPTTGDRIAVVRRGSRCEAVQSRCVPHGTIERRSVMYPSVDAYYAAHRAGRVRWGRWS